MPSSIFYSPKLLLSHHCLFNFVLGERGVGKTFSFKQYVIQNFIRTGQQFVYVRRFKSELDPSARTFFDQLLDAHTFPDDTALSVKKQKGYYTFEVNGLVAGFGIALTTSRILKSTSFPNVSSIIFDEFTLASGSSYHYLKDEVTQFLDLVETISRLRDVPVFCLGNSTSLNNPYFIYFKLRLPYGKKDIITFKNNLIAVQYITNLAYREEKSHTRFGQLISGTAYGDYAINNDFLEDNTKFLRKKSKDAHLYYNLILNGKTYGLWHDSINEIMYLSKDFNPNNKFRLALNLTDHSADTVLLRANTESIFKRMKFYFEHGALFFESLEIQTAVLKFLSVV